MSALGLKFVHNDGGRNLAGFRGTTGDCVVRSIAIATGINYLQVYNDLHEAIKRSKLKKERGGSPRNGVASKIYRPYLERLGWHWTPAMGIGTGCKVHLVRDELPAGTLIVRLSKHLTVVENGVIYDTHDPQWFTVYEDGRAASRCVYGYFAKDF